jgi:arabinogalactan endo-1,4-beta-galactosidase
LGADLSYLNEMEDCGAIYYDADGNASDPYELFSEAGCQLVRLRLWHTPSWYDTLNSGQRYSDLEDVKISIQRSKANNMPVLLDFHLSDFWADPSRQWIPDAWADIAEDLPLLQDSLFNYLHQTLLALHSEGLLPEMIQIGNETNREILQTIEANEANAPIDWQRNEVLFNTAIQAVRAAESQLNVPIKIMLHFAGPDETAHFVDAFTEAGIVDFDLIGMSYYWQWHQPTTIEEMGSIIAALQTAYPEYASMIVEAGYPWTASNLDAANNILYSSAPGYTPLSHEQQLAWLTDMSAAAIDNGASGIIYWEPAWVSTPCYTPWAKGSHYENATFFDANHQVASPGGMDWFKQVFSSTASEVEQEGSKELKVHYHSHSLRLFIPSDWPPGIYTISIADSTGRLLHTASVDWQSQDAVSLRLPAPLQHGGLYFLKVEDKKQRTASLSFVIPD